MYRMPMPTEANKNDIYIYMWMFQLCIPAKPGWFFDEVRQNLCMSLEDRGICVNMSITGPILLPVLDDDG